MELEWARESRQVEGLDCLYGGADRLLGEMQIGGALSMRPFNSRLSVVVLGLFLTTCAQSPSSMSPVPTEQGSLAPSPTTGEPTAGETRRWVEVGSFGGAGSTEHVLGVTFGAGQFVAVGIHYDVGGLPDTGPVPHDGRVWLSPDGASWETLSSGSTFEGVTFSGLLTLLDGSVLAFGRIDQDEGPSLEHPGEPATWRSVDGRTWERVDVGLPVGFFATAAAQGAKGYLLVGSFEFEDPRQLWLSPDGLRWQQVYISSGTYIVDIGAGDDGFVSLLSGAGVNRVTIASADGREWVDGDTTLAGFGPLAPLGGDWITTDASVVETHVIPIWFSANGLAWAKVADISDPGYGEGFGYARELTSAGGSVFLSGARRTTASVAIPGGVWSSRDGHTWELTDIRADGLVLAAAEHDGAVVLAGYVGVNQGRATFWIGPME